MRAAGGIILAEHANWCAQTSTQDSRSFDTRPRALPRANELETQLMKKNEFSEIGSNLLIVGSVSLAFAPFLLGDRLGLVVSGLMKDSVVLVTQFSNYVSWLVS